MTEILFLVEEDPEGGYTAKAVNHSIYTEADTYDQLKKMINDAVKCHFEKGKIPAFIRIHLVHEEILPLSA